MHFAMQLYRHSLSHSEERRYVCTVCTWQNRKDAAVRHGNNDSNKEEDDQIRKEEEEGYYVLSPIR
jgi:hypothetical protein